MNAETAKGEIFLTAYRSLKKKEREAVKGVFLNDKEFLEDLRDILLIEQRKHEPRRPLRVILKELQTKK